MSLRTQFTSLQSTVTQIVTDRPEALSAFDLETKQKPDSELLTDTELESLFGLPLFMGFFTKSTTLKLLDNTVARPTPYKTILPNDESFLTLYPEVAFQIMKFNDEFKQMPLGLFKSKI